MRARQEFGWLDGWMVGWLDGWMVGWLDGWMVGWLDGWMVGEEVRREPTHRRARALPLPILF